MLEKAPTSIRWLLRERTSQRHAKVEGMFEEFDLSERAGLNCFLAAQLSALTAIRTALSGHAFSDIHAEIERLLQLIEMDLAELGEHRGIPVLNVEATAHPLGFAYVVAGSRLGARILARRVAASSDPKVRAANRYLSSAEYETLWRDFQNLLPSSPSAAEADAIIDGAEKGFGCFEDAFRQVKDQMRDGRAENIV